MASSRGPSTPRALRVVIADDHDLARLGLRALLASERNLEVVGEAATGREAIEVCRRSRPDLVLMDVRMPDLDGVAATRAIKAEMPTTCVIVVTMHAEPDYLFEALKAGAAGYLLKESSRTEVIEAIRAATRGEMLFDPALAARLLQRLAAEAQAHLPVSPRHDLTAREVEVLRLVARGMTNREIGERLVVSPATVKVHVERLIGKLGVSDRTQAAVRAVEMGLTGPDVDPAER